MPRGKKKSGESAGSVVTLLPPNTDISTPISGAVEALDLFQRVDSHIQQDRIALEEALRDNQQRETFIQSERAKILERLQMIGVKTAIESPSIPIVASNGPVSAKEMSLVDALVAALQQAGGPLNVGDLTSGVKKLGYKSKSDNFRGIVNQTLTKAKKVFKNTGRGVYDLRDRESAPLFAGMGAPAASSAAVPSVSARPGSAVEKVLIVLQKLGKNVTAGDINAELKRQYPEVTKVQFSSALQSLRGKMKNGKQIDPDSRVTVTGEARAFRYTAAV